MVSIITSEELLEVFRIQGWPRKDTKQGSEIKSNQSFQKCLFLSLSLFIKGSLKPAEGSSSRWSEEMGRSTMDLQEFLRFVDTPSKEGMRGSVIDKIFKAFQSFFKAQS